MEKVDLPNLLEDTELDTSSGVRRRVTKACQRCRLKKCKCDGSSPCARCIADDAICMYGKHKKSERTVYRKGYVQMLERQHSQLIAGVHEIFKLGQQGKEWPQALLDLSHHTEGQPLIHQILEALGVLQCSPQDEADDPNGDWKIFEHHPQDGGVFDNSATPSPTLQNPILGYLETSQRPTVPYRSTSSQQGHSHFEINRPLDNGYNPRSSDMSLLHTRPEQMPSSSANMAYLMQQHQQQELPDSFPGQQSYGKTVGFGGNASMTVNWSGIQNLFDGNAKEY